MGPEVWVHRGSELVWGPLLLPVALSCKLLSFLSQMKPGLHRKLHTTAAKEPVDAALNPAEAQDCTHFSLMKTRKEAEPAFLELGI